MNIIFLDIDGVLNCELFYKGVHHSIVKKQLKKEAKKIDWSQYYKSQLCPERMSWLNDLCKEIEAKIVISSTWRLGKTVEELQQILNESGATFEVIDKTTHTGYERGTEISIWLKDNSEKFCGIKYYDFRDYVIIDDDSDMLLNQKEHFFQTDNYSGLTPTICYKIKRFFTKKTFDE